MYLFPSGMPMIYMLDFLIISFYFFSLHRAFIFSLYKNFQCISFLSCDLCSILLFGQSWFHRYCFHLFVCLPLLCLFCTWTALIILLVFLWKLSFASERTLILLVASSPCSEGSHTLCLLSSLSGLLTFILRSPQLSVCLTHLGEAQQQFQSRKANFESIGRNKLCSIHHLTQILSIAVLLLLRLK